MSADLDQTAAAYVLGISRGAARAAIEARLSSDPALHFSTRFSTPKRVDVSEPRDQWATARRVVEGNAGHEHTIEEALQDSRYVKPPLRKDENELLGQHEPRGIAGDGPAIIRCREIAATLGAGKTRIEVVSIKINHVDLDAATLERRADAAAALAKALSSGWATTRSTRKEGLFRFSRACRHDHKGGFYCGDILRLTSIR